MSDSVNLYEKSENVYTQLINKIEANSKDIQVNPVNIIPITIQTMSLINKYTDSNTSGDDKKKICHTVLDKLMANVEINDKELVMSFLTNTLNTFIDSVIDISKGKYKFNYTCFSKAGKKIKDFFLCKKQ